MKLRSGKITNYNVKSKHPKHNEIVFVVQNLINKVNDCDCRKEKVRYCTKIFNYLLENKDFVNRYDHKRFYITIVNKILEFRSENKLLAYPLYKGTKYYFENLSNLPYRKVIVSKYLNNDFNNHTCYNYRENFFYRNDQIKKHIENKEKICRNISFKRISLYKLCYETISKNIKEKNLNVKQIRSLRLTYFMKKDLINEYLIMNVTQGDKNYNSWDNRLRKLPSRYKLIN